VPGADLVDAQAQGITPSAPLAERGGDQVPAKEGVAQTEGTG
jgi:hypothetical protein